MKICVHTLGCKVNSYESDCIACALIKDGFEVTNTLENADVFVINTCAVTNEAERKSRQAVAKVAKLNPLAKVFVCGCASQNNFKQFSKNENVVFVCGNANKMSVVQEIENFANKSIIKQIKDCDCKIANPQLPNEYEDMQNSMPSKTRAYIKIQDGCNNFCSYCLIPYVRGRSRSRNIISILNEVDSIKDSVKEIVLTGIDISSFSVDGEPALSQLLLLLSNYNLRVRLGSLEVGAITDDLIETLNSCANICPHFHLSLQSGSESVLKRMNRNYKPKNFIKAVKKLREIYTIPSITTDVIVGFPGETNKEFKQTLNFCKKVGFFNMHIFPYSFREGTAAAKLIQKDYVGYNIISDETKHKRVAQLEKLNKKLNAKFIAKCKKLPHQVLIEQFADGLFVGHSENYIKCYIAAEGLQENTFVNVLIDKPFKDGALCVISQ